MLCPGVILQAPSPGLNLLTYVVDSRVVSIQGSSCLVLKRSLVVGVPRSLGGGRTPTILGMYKS